MARLTTRVETLVSAGGVVYRRGDGTIDVVLCGRSTPVRWSLAKGTPDEGESLEETALREVNEETGLEVTLDSSLGSIDYWFGGRDTQVRYHKTVHFYLMKAVGGDTERHDAEFDVVRWFPLEEALMIAAYPNEAKVLRQALEMISMGNGEA